MKYGCQEYYITRLCRYDRRAIDSMCNGCNRTTDKEYLESHGLWIKGISHNDSNCAKIITHSHGDNHGL